METITSADPAYRSVSKFEIVLRCTPDALAKSANDHFNAARPILTCAGFTTCFPCDKYTSDVSTTSQWEQTIMNTHNPLSGNDTGLPNAGEKS